MLYTQIRAHSISNKHTYDGFECEKNWKRLVERRHCKRNYELVNRYSVLKMFVRVRHQCENKHQLSLVLKSIADIPHESVNERTSIF